ncbi:MAG: molybdopterin-dependent oxidoreductase [Halieaceae bacterium]|nr:molybdopterin-dependent oxidoreductase [Halieaceae bacterium]
MTDTISVQQHHRVCHLCEAMCGLVIETRGAEVVSMKGDKADPLSRGHVCPKSVAIADIHNDPDRLRQPLRRVRTQAGEYTHEPVSWETALDAVADGLVDTIHRHGVNAVAVYMGNPTVHNYGMLTHQSALFRYIRTNNRYSATSVDQLPHHLVAMWLFGHKLLFPIPDIDRTDYFLMLGANPLASNGSIWTVPDVRKRIKALRARGGKLVVIDPRRTETAALADEHHFIRPGTDAVLLLSLIHVLFSDDLVRLDHLEPLVLGLDEVASKVAAFTPAYAASVTGIDEASITHIAHALAAADKGICYGRMGISTQRFGTLCQWAVQVLNILTGNLDRPGGSLFTLPAVDQLGMTGPGGFGRHHSRLRNLPEFDRELPVAALAEEITTPGEGQVRALFTGAGNPVLSTPAGHLLDEALEQLDFMVSLDPYLNESTRHADYILPPTSPLEHDHYDLAFHHNAIRNTSRYNPAVFEAPEGALHDWEIFEALGARVAERLDQSHKPSPAPHELMDMALKVGPYGAETEHDLSLDKLRANPSGVDLGPLKPQLPGRLRTADGKINLAVTEVLTDIARLREECQADTSEMRLIGRRHVRDNNSWMHNFHRLMKGRARCTLMIHPDDAQEKGIRDGDDVEIISRSGRLIAPAVLTDEIMPGVVSLPHGYGHGVRGIRAATATDYAGVSCNDITDAEWLDEVSGNAAVNGVPVSLSKVSA